MSIEHHDVWIATDEQIIASQEAEIAKLRKEVERLKVFEAATIPRPASEWTWEQGACWWWSVSKAGHVNFLGPKGRSTVASFPPGSTYYWTPIEDSIIDRVGDFLRKMASSWEDKS